MPALSTRTAVLLAACAPTRSALLAAPCLARPIPAAALARPAPAMTALDITRTRVSLEGYTSYSVVAALIMNAALSLLASTQTVVKPMTWRARAMQLALYFCISVSVLCAAYTTVNFALVSIYAKTAIGIGLDDQCATLLTLTQPYRATAFRSFVCCLGSFCFSFPLAVYFRLRMVLASENNEYAPTIAALAMCAGVAITLRMSQDWSTIIAMATEHVYKARVALGK